MSLYSKPPPAVADLDATLPYILARFARPLRTARRRSPILPHRLDRSTVVDLSSLPLCRQAAERDRLLAAPEGRSCVTYRDLMERAGRLADGLRGLGIPPGAEVAVCLPRTLDLAVALAGIWRAGAVALPLPLNGAGERPEWLEERGVTVAVTRETLAAWLPGAVRRVFLEDGEIRLPLPWSPPASPLPHACAAGCAGGLSAVVFLGKFLESLEKEGAPRDSEALIRRFVHTLVSRDGLAGIPLVEKLVEKLVEILAPDSGPDVHLNPEGERMTGTQYTRTEPFDRPTLDLWRDGCERLLRQASADPDRPLPDLSFLSDPEQLTLELLGSALGDEGHTGGGTATAHPTLIEMQPKGSRTPFFCVHPVGGSVSCYEDLARWMKEDRPFLGLQAPPSDGLRGLRSLEDLAAQHVQRLREVQPEGPYLLGGWSMGGLLALEMAQQLRTAGQRVELLCLLDPTPPRRASDPPPREGDLAVGFARDLAGLYGVRLPADALELAGEPPRDGLRRRVERWRAAGLLPSDLTFDDLWERFEVYRWNAGSVYGYTPRAYGGSIALFAAQRPGGKGADLPAAWRPLAAAALEVHHVPGDHYTLLREPCVKALAHSLRSRLNRT